MSFIAKGGQVGSIVRDGKEVCQQFEWFCMHHPKPIKMLKSLAESIEKKEKKKLIVSGAHCIKCSQYVEEGKWYED